MWDFYKDESLGDYIESRLFDDREPLSNQMPQEQINGIRTADPGIRSDSDFRKTYAEELPNIRSNEDYKKLVSQDSPVKVNVKYDPNTKIQGEEMVIEGKPTKEQSVPKKESKNNNIEAKTGKILESLAKRVRNKEAENIIARLQEKVDAQESANKRQVIDKETGIRDKVQERRNESNFTQDEWNRIFKNLLKK